MLLNPTLSVKSPTNTKKKPSQQHLTLKDIIGKGQELPSLPEIYLRVSEQLEDEKVSAKEIGKTVENDPAISTRMLKMVNSAYYGLPKQVSAIAKAISLLGRDRVRHILIGSVLGGVFSGKSNEAFSMLEFWQHSIRTAIIARQLACEVDMHDEADADTMFTAGLLHNIGTLLLSIKAPELVLASRQWSQQKRVDIHAAELAVIGVSHTEVSEAIMQHWSLPQLLIDCAITHHQAQHNGPHCHATHLIYLANNLATNIPPIDDQETMDILWRIPNWDFSNLTLSRVAYACQQAEEQMFEVMESLGLVTIEIGEEDSAIECD